ncbi:hypothetical protein [Streptomyces niveus]|uniref:hypothetical protein n=1 Tax=Streptomyces niveus TaxID=193462 RepID=UPI00342483F6
MIGGTPPHVGALVLDTAAGRLAEYRGPVGGLRLLRAYLGAYDADCRYLIATC